MRQHYIMRDQARGQVDQIMRYDPTWRSKRAPLMGQAALISGIVGLALLSHSFVI